MIVGHCLGSVIAYDTLWQMSREHNLSDRVSYFVTLGSPLGDNNVRSRLLGRGHTSVGQYPNNLIRDGTTSPLRMITYVTTRRWAMILKPCLNIAC